MLQQPEMRLSDDGMIAHKVSEDDEDISGEKRNWVIAYVPLPEEHYDAWVGFPLYDSEVEDWMILPNFPALVDCIEN